VNPFVYTNIHYELTPGSFNSICTQRSTLNKMTLHSAAGDGDHISRSILGKRHGRGSDEDDGGDPPRFGSGKRFKPTGTARRTRDPSSPFTPGSHAAKQPATANPARAHPEATYGDRIDAFYFKSRLNLPDEVHVEMPDNLSDGAKMEILEIDKKMAKVYRDHYRFISSDLMLSEGKLLEIERKMKLLELKKRAADNAAAKAQGNPSDNGVNLARFGSEKRSRPTKQRDRAPYHPTASGSCPATQPVTANAARAPPAAFVGNRIEMFRFGSPVQLPDDHG
jgi:hypothetical protein